jgi:hypothetical protein
MGYNTWQKNLACSKEKVEAYLKKQGYSFKWRDDDSLDYWQTFKQVLPHPITGERCWFNQIHAQHKTFYFDHPKFKGKLDPSSDRWPVHTVYGDGTEIEEEVIDHIRAVRKKSIEICNFFILKSSIFNQ